MLPNGIDFVIHIIENLPFRSKEIRTDNSPKLHWHVEDQGIRHAYIQRGAPQLKGKVELFLVGPKGASRDPLIERRRRSHSQNQRIGIPYEALRGRL